MAVIKTLYSVGDVVWLANTTTEKKQHPCPDCLGERKWKAITPAGDEYGFACPRCAARHRSFDKQSLGYTAHVPLARRLTIGSVRHESAGAFGAGPKTTYMCVETGVGSGSVYDEDRLFLEEERALSAASLLADKANESGWIAERYDGSLEISDYQLESARLKEAADALSEARSFVWNINDLFETISELSGKDEILEAIEDYKSWQGKRDRERVASVNTHPEGGDGEAAPFMGSAVRDSGDAQ